LGRNCVGEGTDVGKAIEAVTSGVMMVSDIPGVVHDAKNSRLHFIDHVLSTKLICVDIIWYD